jgi:tetratricopeptide (TPR) repeat protein
MHRHHLILLFLLTLAFSRCNTQTMAAKQYETGDSLLQTLFTQVGITDPHKALHAGYDQPDPQTRIADAKRAADCFEKSLATVHTAEAKIDHWEKLAWCYHFQSNDFAYQETFPPSYTTALHYIDQAIEAQKLLPPNARMAELYETAATITIPHFYFGFTSPNAVKAQERAFDYLRQAEETYLRLEDKASALRVLRSFQENTLVFSFRKITLGEAVDPTSIEYAQDIAHLVNQLMLEPLPEDSIAAVEKRMRIAKDIYQEKATTEEEWQSYRRFMGDAGYYYHFQRNDPKTALQYYSVVQEIETDQGWEHYYYAFRIAALHIEHQEWELARPQYELALKDTVLSVTDKEHAGFGLAMVAWLSHRTSEAVAIWNTHITDRDIMNGVSSYPGNFSPSFRPFLKTNAIEFLTSLHAPNALRIVRENWN